MSVAIKAIYLSLYCAGKKNHTGRN